MALRTFVKISSVTDLSDARYCAGMMVDVLGFNIDPSSHVAISLNDFLEITNWVAGVSFAGEFYSASIQQIKETIKNYPIDFIEIDKLDFIEEVALLGKPVIFRSVINSSNLHMLRSTLARLNDPVRIMLLKCNEPSIYEKLDAEIRYYNGHLKLLKGYDIKKDAPLHDYPGIELVATEEKRPGYKDYGDIMEVLEAIEADEPESF